MGFIHRIWPRRLLLTGALTLLGFVAIPNLIQYWRSRMSNKRLQYPYQDLPNPRSIRLLKVARGVFSSTFYYSLCPFPLDNAPEYVALSYTWGEAVEPDDEDSHLSCPRECYLNLGRFFVPITGNLDDFLKIWEPQAGTKHIWIDAICINQLNIIEKESQIPLMGDIYSSAERVIAWLGRDERHLDSMQWIHEEFYDAAMAYLDEHGIDAYLDNNLQLFSSALYHALGIQIPLTQSIQHWRAYRSFYNTRRWFHRAWVVQEVTLARDITVLCGNGRNLSWEAMIGLRNLDGVANLDITGAGFERAFSSTDDPPPMMHIGSLEMMKGFYKIGTRQSSEGGKHHAMLQRWLRSNEPEEQWFALLLWFLRLTRHYKATDSRDKVFSLLGISNKCLPPGMKPPISPSYSKSKKDVYMNVAIYLLTKLPRLVFLSEAKQTQEHIMGKLPSWTPDLETQQNLSISMNFCTTVGCEIPYDTWPLSPDKEAQLNFRNDVLIVNGTEFDKVSKVATFPVGYSQEIMVPFIEFCAHLSLTYLPTQQARAEAIWRTLIGDWDGDQAKYSFPAPASLGKSFRAYLLHFISSFAALEPSLDWIQVLAPLGNLNTSEDELVFPKPVEIVERRSQMATELAHSTNVDLTLCNLEERFSPPTEPWLSAYGAICNGRAIFKTSKGYVGSGPNNMAAGDQICLLESARTPFILRRMQNSHQYKLVGEAYVHGIMQGQALTPELMSGVGPIEIA